MSEEKIKEYYNLLDMLSVSIFAARWLNENREFQNEKLIKLNEFLYRELLKWGVNNIGTVNE